MRGDAFAKECRQRYPELAIVLATGHSERAVRALFAADAKVEVVEKPYEFPAILDRLERLGVAV
jgi:hypothetical protein